MVGPLNKVGTKLSRGGQFCFRRRTIRRWFFLGNPIDNLRVRRTVFLCKSPPPSPRARQLL